MGRSTFAVRAVSRSSGFLENPSPTWVFPGLKVQRGCAMLSIFSNIRRIASGFVNTAPMTVLRIQMISMCHHLVAGDNGPEMQQREENC